MISYSTDELYVIFEYNKYEISKVFTNEFDAIFECDKFRDAKISNYREYYKHLTDDEFINHFKTIKIVDVMTLKQAIDLIVEETEEFAVAPYMDESL